MFLSLWSFSDCENGFYGINCETKCPFQYFGRKCLSKCNCTGKECHHVYGCESSTPGGTVLVKGFFTYHVRSVKYLINYAANTCAQTDVIVFYYMDNKNMNFDFS